MSNDFLIPIIPRQLDKHFKSFDDHEESIRKRRYRPIAGRYFSPKLNVKNFEDALTKSNVVMDNVSIIDNPTNLIFYQYGDKPMIVLNLNDGKFYTTKGTLEHYELPLIELQAYIITEILRKHKLSGAVRSKARIKRVDTGVTQ